MPARVASNPPAAPTVWAEAQQSRGHLAVLDGVRGLAILLVLVHHQTIMGATTTFDRIAFRLTDLGWCGVDLFFVLSGFLITGILFDSKGANAYFRNFYVRRTLRIFPLYYAVVFLSLVVLPRFPQWEPLLLHRPLPESGDGFAYWFYVSNFLFASRDDFAHPLLGGSWSLAIEEQFYLLWPLVVWRLGRTALMRISAALVCAAFLLRLGLLQAGAHPIDPYVLPFARMDTLAVGAFIALAYRSEGGLSRLKAAAWAIGPIALVIVLAIWRGDTGNERWAGRAMQMWGYTALALGFGSFLVAALTAPAKGRLARILSGPLLRAFGKYSYAIYLTHFPLQVFIERRWFQPTSPIPDFFGSQVPAQIVFFLVAMAAALGAGWASWHLYEKHFLALKRYFPTGMAAVKPRPVAALQP